MISEKSEKSNENDIHLCLNAIYAKLILKLKTEITEETENAFEHFRNVLAHLSVRYKDMKAGTLTIKMETLRSLNTDIKF